MAVSHYDRLSHLDNSFLAIESRATHMHVAAIAEFQTGPILDRDGSVDADLIRRFVESKLHLMPRYRQRLAYVPVEKHPVWVDDEHFNIEYHVRHTSLPKPGGHDQLLAMMGRLVSQQLDRSKPLWELYIVEGVHDGHFALIFKTHHAMIDGIAGVDLMAALLNLAPTTDVDDPEQFTPRPAPTGSELLVREGFRRAGKAVSMMRNATEISDQAQTLLMDSVRRVRAVGHSLSSGWLTKAADTDLNGTVGPNRRFATMELALDDVKAVKNALGGSVNDVVLATVTGAVRRYLQAQGTAVDDLDFRVMAPVSVRSETDRGGMGNQVAMWLVTLPVGEPDVVSQFRAVHEETDKLKRTDQALGASTLVRLSAGGPTILVAMAARLAANARPFNMTVTNVPGPQFPLYMLDSKLIGTYPLVPLWEGHGAGIALFSYAGSLFWGINADWDVVPDLGPVVAALKESFAELQRVAAAMAAGDTPPETDAPVEPAAKTSKSKRSGATKSRAKTTASEESKAAAPPRKPPPFGAHAENVADDDGAAGPSGDADAPDGEISVRNTSG